MVDLYKLEKAAKEFYDETTPKKLKDLTDFEKKKREIELKLLSPEKGTNQEAISIAAEYIMSFNSIKCIRQDDKDEFYIYREGIYKPEGKTYILEICERLFHVAYTSQKANNVCNIIKVNCFIDAKDFFDQQLNYAHIIAVNNGILDLKKKTLIDFSPEYYFFNKLPMNYNVNSECKNFEKFVSQITKDFDDVKVIQELFGFSLIKDYKFEKAFMFYGSHGRNGKSKLLEILTHFVGLDNVSNIDLEDFNKDNFAVSNLRNKLLNIASDIGNEDITSTGIFKKLTGRDQVQANRKNQSRISFVNYAKMVFSANELPFIDTNSDAFWLRWVIIEFPYQFLPKKEIDALPDYKKENVFLQDPDIVDNLVNDNELEGILNWAIIGFHRLLKNKDFSNKDTAKQIRISWLRKSNSVSAFIADEIDIDYDSYVTKVDFKKNYLSYCKNNYIRPLGDAVIKRTLEKDVGATSNRRNVDFNNGFSNVNERIYVWEGISFKTKVVELKKDNNISKQDIVVSEEFVEDDRLAVRKSMGDVVEFRSGKFKEVN